MNYKNLLLTLLVLCVTSAMAQTKTKQASFSFYINNELHTATPTSKPKLWGTDVTVAKNALATKSSLYLASELPKNYVASPNTVLFQAYNNSNDIWIITEKNKNTTDYSVWMYNATSDKKELLFNNNTSPNPSWVYSTVGFNSKTKTIIVEAEDAQNDEPHKGIWEYNMSTKKFTKLKITNAYTSQPLVSPDGKYLIYTATSQLPVDYVHSSSDIIKLFDLTIKKEKTLVTAKSHQFIHILGWNITTPTKKDIIDVNQQEQNKSQSSVTPSFKLPWKSGISYCVTRMGTPAPTGAHTPVSFCSGYSGYNPHGYLAVDFDSPNNVYDPILASDGGVVVFSGIAAGGINTGYGRYIKLKHSDGTITYYAHLNAAYVSLGDTVCQGTLLGDGGNTGGSSGDHIHFEWRAPGGASGSQMYPTFQETGGVPHPAYKYTSANVIATCSALADVVPPTVQLTNGTGWKSNDFTAAFTDVDNTGGSGINEKFILVSDFDGKEWNSNTQNGYFIDNFDTTLRSTWVKPTGTWNTIPGGLLEQTDESLSNTNIYNSVNQSSASKYLYHWSGYINGTGTNKRAGLHFFCDNASQTQRGNSYLVLFRSDDSLIEVYKSTNNTVSNPLKQETVVINDGQWYDFKITYNKPTGEIRVYLDDALKLSWTDASPHQSANAVSLRSGNCNYKVDNFKVYKTRTSSTAISIGTATTDDIQHENYAPTLPGGQIITIANDNAFNFSDEVYSDVNVDWTIPSKVPSVNDGSGADITYFGSFTDIAANWPAAKDTNSGIAKYWYAIGTTALGTDIVNWTDNASATSVNHTGLSLINNQIYFVSVKAENGAGMQSAALSSNGQILNPSLSSIEEENKSIVFNVFPNPFNNELTVNYEAASEAKADVKLYNQLGQTLPITTERKTNGKSHQLKFTTENLPQGFYYLNLHISNKEYNLKIVKSK